MYYDLINCKSRGGNTCRACWLISVISKYAVSHNRDDPQHLRGLYLVLIRHHLQRPSVDTPHHVRSLITVVFPWPQNHIFSFLSQSPPSSPTSTADFRPRRNYQFYSLVVHIYCHYLSVGRRGPERFIVQSCNDKCILIL
jgi:hypothetical protein